MNIILKNFEWSHICNDLSRMFSIDILDSSKHCLFSVFGIQVLYFSNYVFIIYLFIFPFISFL